MLTAAGIPTLLRDRLCIPVDMKLELTSGAKMKNAWSLTSVPCSVVLKHLLAVSQPARQKRISIGRTDPIGCLSTSHHVRGNREEGYLPTNRITALDLFRLLISQSVGLLLLRVIPYTRLRHLKEVELLAEGADGTLLYQGCLNSIAVNTHTDGLHPSRFDLDENFCCCRQICCHKPYISLHVRNTSLFNDAEIT